MGYSARHMFDVLVYLYETYWRPDAFPNPRQLSRKLSAAGFDDDDIREALAWLDGLTAATAASPDAARPASLRIFSPAELEHLGADCIGFLSFLESAGVLPAPMRELVLDRVMALPGDPVDLEALKICVLMVYWALGEEPDTLMLDELMVSADERIVH